MSLTIPPRPEGFHWRQPPPGYRKLLVSFNDERRVIAPRLQLAHTNGAKGPGSIEASKAWAERRTVNGVATTLPHFQVDLDGDAAMLLELNRQPIANARANPFSIAYETADTGYAADPTISAFTEAQVQMIANGFAYCSMLFKIPLNYPTTWDGWGSASHTEPFGYPYWTSYDGKICPGRKKKQQVAATILPHARRIVAAWTGSTSQPQPPPSEEDDDVMYLATLSDGRVVVVGSSVRPVSGEEVSGPFAGLPKLKPAPSSYWHQWIKAGADEYSKRIGM